MIETCRNVHELMIYRINQVEENNTYDVQAKIS